MGCYLDFSINLTSLPIRVVGAIYSRPIYELPRDMQTLSLLMENLKTYVYHWISAEQCLGIGSVIK